MSRITAPRIASFLWAALAACGAIREPHVEDLDDIPGRCRILFQANSWEELVLRSRPSAVLERDSYLLVWSRKSDDGSWSFEMAAPFLILREGAPFWAVLSEPQEWWGSPLEGLFVSGKARYPTTDIHDGPHNYAELVGTSKSWGTVFKVGCTSVPGGVHENQSTLAILLWQRTDGGWEILWAGDECTSWRMGTYGVHRDHRFHLAEKPAGLASPLPFDIRADLCVTHYPSFELDLYARFILDFHRQGRLAGPAPMRTEWTTPWFYEARKGDTWESLARSILYCRAGVEDAVKDPQGELKEGQTVFFPTWIWP